MPLPRLIRAGALALLCGCAAAPAPPTAAGAAVPPSGPPARGAGDHWELPRLPPPDPVAPEEYAARRARLAAAMQDGVLLVQGAAAPEHDYLSFHQLLAFRYLTGVNEPGAALLLVKRGGTVSERLFVRPRNPSREVWEGAGLGVEGARQRTRIPAYDAARLLPALDSLLRDGGTLYGTTGPEVGIGALSTATPEQQLFRQLVQRYPRVRLASLAAELQQLRASKSPAELDRIRRAVYLTVLAHRAALRALEPGVNEFEIQALIEYTFRRNGAERPAFASIVGSGPNSTTLHYTANDRFMQAGEVVVMDVGASYDGYAADVTRTLPVGGRFSPEQRAVYQVVLAAQKAAEARARPGATWRQLGAAADSVLAEGLARLGLIESPGATYQCGLQAGARCPQLRLFYLHDLGHGIGLEVHDPDVSFFGAFRAGSAFTIEPGIYVREDALDHLPDTPENRALAQRLRPAVQRYRDIGVRIEDDYLITATGAERLSAGAPREVEEIETLMSLEEGSAAGRRPEVVEWYRTLRPR